MARREDVGGVGKCGDEGRSLAFLWGECGGGAVLERYWQAGSREQVVNVGEIERCGDVGGCFMYMSYFNL
jgi:hypothetical protein